MKEIDMCRCFPVGFKGQYVPCVLEPQYFLIEGLISIAPGKYNLLLKPDIKVFFNQFMADHIQLWLLQKLD